MKRRLAFLSALAGALFPAVAHADLDSERWNPGGGIFVGYAFGETSGVVWGAEAFATYRVTGLGCGNYDRAGLGPLARIALVGLGSPRLTVAVQGGGEFQRSIAAGIVELGGTYRFGDRAGFGIHTGLGLESFLVNSFVRGDWILNDGSIGVGARMLPTYGAPSFCVVGRPLRTAHGQACVSPTGRRLPHAPRKKATNAPEPRETPSNEAMQLAAREWESDAQYECASVPAFLQLAEELLAHDAPDELVFAALSAASDEIRHAHLCAAIASRYAGVRITPVLPDVARRASLPGLPGLIRLAEESFIDGCLSEGAAATRAARAAELARDPVANAVQAVIAADEARHAELGWSVLRWAVRQGGDDVHDAVRDLRDADVGRLSADGDEAVVPYGRVGAQHTQLAFERNRAESRRRLDAIS